MTNDDVELKRDLERILNERSDRRQKRARTFFDVQPFLPISGVISVFLSSPFFAFADVTATAFSALAVFSPTSEPQYSKLPSAHKQVKQRFKIVCRVFQTNRTNAVTVLHCLEILSQRIRHSMLSLRITCAVPVFYPCLLYTSPSPRDRQKSRMPSSA